MTKLEIRELVDVSLAILTPEAFYKIIGEVDLYVVTIRIYGYASLCVYLALLVWKQSMVMDLSLSTLWDHIDLVKFLDK